METADAFVFFAGKRTYPMYSSTYCYRFWLRKFDKLFEHPSVTF